MQKFSFKILKIGMAVTFLWIGILIFKAPEAWGSFLQPWAANLLSDSLKTAMLGTAFLDIAIGILFLINRLAWLAALLGSFHLMIIFIVSGVNAITVRDIGLLAAALAIFFDSFPSNKFKKVASIIYFGDGNTPPFRAGMKAAEGIRPVSRCRGIARPFGAGRIHNLL